MTEKEHSKLQVETGEWLLKEITIIVEQYKACKTAHCRCKLLPKLQCLTDKAEFEIREILK